MTESTCSVRDCGKPIKRLEWCYGHYMKQWRYGTPTPTHEPKHATDVVGQRFGHLLVTAERDGHHWVCICDCGGRALATRHGLLSGMRVACGDRSTHYRTDTAGYYAAHDRVRQDRGRASDHECVDCGGRAAEWSYNHGDVDERTSAAKYSLGALYSLDSGYYSPRCVPCHRRFDENPVAMGTARRATASRISPRA